MSSELTALFQSAYGHPPTIICAAPGRVNIIGEHIDYSGYGVLPMALHQTVCIASRTRCDSGLDVRNVNRDVYADVTLPGDPCAAIGPHTWASYVHAAYKGVCDYLNAKHLHDGPLQALGLQLLVHGQVPPGAGVPCTRSILA